MVHDIVVPARDAPATLPQKSGRIRTSKIVSVIEQKLESFDLELRRIKLAPDEALFIKAPADTDIDRLKTLAEATAYIVGPDRRFVITTDDLAFSIIKDDMGTINAWHGGPAC